jgi:hypothetical protein
MDEIRKIKNVAEDELMAEAKELDAEAQIGG